MAYKGQPFESTVYHAARAKISDGKSVRVKSGSVNVEAGKFYFLEGFLGAAMTSATAAEVDKDVTLNIEPAEYETDQIKVEDKASMDVGTDIYWDDGDSYFTVSATAIYAGKITAAADDNGVIWFKLAERPYSLDDVTELSGVVGDFGSLDLDVAISPSATSVVDALNKIDGKVGDLGDLKTTEQSSIAGAINEVVEDIIGDLSDLDPAPLVATTVVGVLNEKVAAKIDAIAEVENLVVTDATDLKAVATQLNALITALITAGLMAED